MFFKRSVIKYMFKITYLYRGKRFSRIYPESIALRRLVFLINHGAFIIEVKMFKSYDFSKYFNV